jgi:hypothetical protein
MNAEIGNNKIKLKLLKKILLEQLKSNVQLCY